MQGYPPAALGLCAELKALCDEAGIGFMSTPFDLVSVDCLVPLAMDYWKIPFGRDYEPALSAEDRSTWEDV